MGIDMRRNKDLDDVFGLTPVVPSGPVQPTPCQVPQKLLPGIRVDRPLPGILVPATKAVIDVIDTVPATKASAAATSVAAPPMKPNDPAKIRQDAIKVLHSMAMLRPEVRQAILECALRMDRA